MIAHSPVRVQRRRVKGWRMPPNTAYVGHPTVFGNLSGCGRPHHCQRRPCGCCPPAEYCCVDRYREFVVSGLEGRPSTGGTISVALDAVSGYPIRSELVRRLPELRGKNLACWCALDAPCHADVLLDLANG